MPTRVTVWNEYVHEQEQSQVAAIYPNGIHGALAEALEEDERVFEVRTATLQDEPDHGLSEAVLQETDVLV